MARQTASIYYYKNINLSRDYSNVCDNISINTLSSYLVYTDTNISVIRHSITNGEFRINRSMAQLENINYIAIINNAGDKEQIFAFIDDLEYIADEVTIIKFSIDLFTTYCQYLDYQDTFIKRMTVNDDTKYTWLQNENIAGGEYITVDTLEDYTTNWNYGYTATTTYTGGTVNGRLLDHIFSYSGFTGYTSYGPVVEDLQLFTSNGYIENVSDVIQYPAECGTNGEHVVDVKYIDQPTTLNGYTPKNNKLFNYPFVRELIVSSDGDTLELYPQNSTDTNHRIQYRKDVMVQPIVQIVATVGQYQGIVASKNKVNRLFITGFPQVNWASDNYQAWLALNKNTRSMENVRIASSVIGNVLTGNTTGTVESGLTVLNTAMNRYVENENAKMLGTTIHRGSNMGIDVCNENFGLITYVQTIKYKEAELIDNYFNAYGYAINKVTYFEPSRTRFDYVETAGELFRRKSEGSGIPNIAIDTMNTVANRGLRIWHSISELNRRDLIDTNSIR